MRFRNTLVHACTAALLVSVTSPTMAIAVDPDDPSAPSTSRVTEVALEEEQAADVWRASLSTQEGVNIVGLTWDQGEAVESDHQHEDGAHEDGEHEDGEHESHDDGGADAPADSGAQELATARMRTRAPGDAWGPWREMVANQTEASTGTEGDLVVGALDVQLELDISGAELSGTPTATNWNESEQRSDLDPALSLTADGAPIDSLRASADATEQAERVSGSNGLAIATRAQWGADESVRKWSPNYIDSQAGVTIHHTAGTNSYTAAQVPAILRGIYRYHALTRDWGDVGYNVFVDKFGRAWEGRRGGPEAALRTAHSLGMNYTSAGVSLLGDYSRTNVPRAAFDTAARVTAWKLGTHDNPATGTFRHENTYEGWTRDLPRIHAHRDVNGTTCPGARFYARMSEFRSLVRSYRDDATVVQRVSGSNRYATAAQIADDAHPFGADTVYVTAGNALIESLVVGTAAAHQDDALLLTGRTSLPSATRSQLIALDPEQVILVGDTDEVTSRVRTQIRNAVDAPVTRLVSSDQYGLAAEVSRQWDGAETVYLASGIEPADALSGGAAAAQDDAPLLLSADADGLPDATAVALTDLAPSTVYMLGGTGRLPRSTTREIQALLPGVTVERLSGTNRYDTSAAVVSHRFEDSPRVMTANGTASIDAIAGTQLADARQSAVLLTRQTCRPRSVSSAMSTVDADLVTLLGGTSRLSDRSATQTC